MSTTTKKVFISYSWSTPEHDDWVLSLAHQLLNDGIDVVLDKWDLKEGQDKFHFMESMVSSCDIDKVLMICDKKYADKADSRLGGVGTETQIITSQVYNKVSQEKFIPVVAEVDEHGQPFLPTYLKSLIYINLSSSENYPLEYEKLLRNILNRPSLSKPKLGTPPSYLYEDSPVNFKTTTMVRGMEVQLDKFPGRVNLFVKDFLAEFDRNLIDFKIENPSNLYLEIGKQILDKLTQYLPLRDDYLSFIDKLTKDDRGFDTDILIRFFENLPLHLSPRGDNYQSWQSGSFEHFKFINHELFIYTVAIALKNDNYRILESLLLSKYFFKSRGQGQVEALDYDRLRSHFDLLDQYYNQLRGRRSDNVYADVLISRVPDFLTKDDLVAGDLLCYHIGQLNNVDWYPIVYGYNGRHRGDFEFFNRIISKRHFEKVKNLLGVSNSSQFKDKLLQIIAKGAEQGYGSFRSRLPSLEYYIKPDNIASLS
ncbi:SEFIR domain-containing protein [Mucilaginibacter jinjuensis]|uniref:TIR domain-containing protein n=1 Tax=Mucilaginibacter jinjuensis TaxID=1176721 RepID=A0ABY7TFB6_9SPHI|nr:SEFIR domain-containing protein [Mucilaginibacter jinjuensis]WCT14423.1 TIR domain-containing protein [Mucilaginibacter jinjuensis]